MDKNADSCSNCGAEFGLFCSACDQEIEPGMLVCPHCGESLDEADENRSAQGVEIVESPQYSGKCPQCDTPIFLEDGFCNHCGTTICSSCGKIVGEEDEVCPHCHLPLFFNCPLCQFELTTGTDQCPNCDALIPSFCTNCQAPLPPGVSVCAGCETKVTAVRRKSARIIHSIMVADKVVQIASCPDCGHQMPMHQGHCDQCSYHFCPRCQINLLEGETICPRCGPLHAQVIQVVSSSKKCPSCDLKLEPLDEECPQCGQLLCPECQAAVTEDDFVCGQCGTEFEFECPECEATVAADAEQCPSCGYEF